MSEVNDDPSNEIGPENVFVRREDDDVQDSDGVLAQTNEGDDEGVSKIAEQIDEQGQRQATTEDPSQHDVQHDQGCHPDRIDPNESELTVSGTPIPFRKFSCSSRNPDPEVSVKSTNKDIAIEDKEAEQSRDREDELRPTIDLTPVKLGSAQEPHVCLNKIGSSCDISQSRHDKEIESSPASQYELEAGSVLDPENEGDALILNKMSSGTSNLTNDLDQLKPGQSPDSEPQDSPGNLIDDKEQPMVNNNGKKIEASNSDHQTETKAKTTNQDDLNLKDSHKDDDDKMEEDHNQQESFEDQHDAFDHCDKHCQKYQPNSDSDSCSSYDQRSSPYEGGMAGLDPDHSNEWVPSVIDLNMSRSKKRRRRHKKNQENRKKKDNLSKLLSGEQTKEDIEYISTLDIGNQHHDKKKARIQPEMEILSGNINRRQGEVQDCSDRSFTATFNSTKHGPDFDDVESLREGSEDEEILQDDEAREGSLSKEGDDIAEEAPEMESHPNTSNINGAKRKRNRNRKQDTTKQPNAGPSTASGTDLAGRATRSKALTRASEASGNKEDINKDDAKDEDRKGEKEKNPQMSPAGQTNVSTSKNPDGNPGVGAVVPFQPAHASKGTAPAGSGQVGVFKQPKIMTRGDIQRIVSKAVQKSKSRVSNNFAFNSKIQRFSVVTNSADVPKFPELDPFAPLMEIAVPEFIWPDQDKTMEGMVNVKSRGTIQFVILARSGHLAHDAWDTPKLDMVRDFASHLLCTIAELKLEFGTILRWTNPWGNVAVMGLDSTNLDMLQKFRTFFTTLRFSHHYFNTFPKDALTSSLGLYIMLKSDLREFKEEYLAEALFARNQLFGVLETLEAETYTASDTTRAGVSKNGWRNVLLQGDEDFLASLSNFPALHWFNIGPASVQIHGGERRAETFAEIEAKNKRKRLNMPVGQSLSNAAKASISQSFLIDQKNLLLNKKNKNKAPTPAPAPTPPPRQESAKAPIKKKK